MMRKDAWENYFYEDSNVLKNKLGITDKKTLEDEERKITLKRLTELQLEPINGNFDIKHLKDIHKYLFFDIYPFAGEFRCCTLAKTTRAFYDPEMILDELAKELKVLNDSFDKLCNNYKDISYLDESFAIAYATILSDAYYQLMTIHPFRDEDEPLEQKATYLQKCLQNKGFTENSKSFFLQKFNEIYINC